MKTLTPAEEQIMQVLWEIERGFVKDILARLPEPKPAYNTVSTVVRILETKGFVDHKAFGKTHEYFPLVARQDYLRHTMNTMVEGYFGGSFKNLVSFFVKENDLKLSDLDELLNEKGKHKKR
ncbi:MAG: BlaI/MecI/CopY family transcriptional regulator [Bacteroidia bacterium]|jgi:predicted transcriptional regulator|nr:BlaI/MecI/CopY family transcriptional regulator [Bacteroidia bacterium]